MTLDQLLESSMRERFADVWRGGEEQASVPFGRWKSLAAWQEMSRDGLAPRLIPLRSSWCVTENDRRAWAELGIDATGVGQKGVADVVADIQGIRS